MTQLSYIMHIASKLYGQHGLCHREHMFGHLTAHLLTNPDRTLKTRSVWPTLLVRIPQTTQELTWIGISKPDELHGRWDACYGATACNATHGIAVAILSVRLSVPPSDACIVTKLNDGLQIFWYHTIRQSLLFSDTNNGWWAMPPSLWNLRSKWPTPSKNADFDRFSLITSQP